MQTKLITLFGLAALLLAAGCSRDSRDGRGQAAQHDANANAAAATKDIGKLDAEIAGLEAQSTKNPDDNSLRESLAEAFVRRGNVHLEARRLKEALADFQTALSHKPDLDEAQERITQINRETQPEPDADDGKPVTVPAKPGAANSNE